MKEDERLMLERMEELVDEGYRPHIGDWAVALVMDSEDAPEKFIEILLEAEKQER